MVLFCIMSTNYLLQAIDICGGQVALGKSIGKTQATISSWINRKNRKISPEFVIAIAKATDFKITPHQLRPDIYPHPHDGMR